MANTLGLTVQKDLVDKVLSDIKALTKKEVLVGVPMDKADRPPDDGEKSPLTNAEIGYLMETGVPEKNIPQRAFLVPGIENAKPDIGKTMEAGAIKSLTGDAEAADKTLHKVGLIGQSAVQKKITDGPFDPLAPVTLAKRKAKGRTGEKPLIDTGSLRQSISYAVRPKGE